MGSNLSPIRELGRRLPGDLRRSFLPMLSCEVAYRTITVMLVSPLVGWLTTRLVRNSGAAAVSNTDIAWFLLSPPGLCGALLLLLGYLVGQFFLGSALMGVAALGLAGRRRSLRLALAVGVGAGLRLFRLGALRILWFAWVFAPFLGLAALTYGLLLGGRDINYYLAERPPSFTIALVIGGLLAIGATLRAAHLYVRGLFVIPIILFEGGAMPSAFEESQRRIDPQFWRVAGVILGWHATVALLSPVVGLLYTFSATLLLDSAGSHVAVLVPLGAFLVLLQGWLIASLAFMQVAGACLLTVRLYNELSGDRGRIWAEEFEPSPPGRWSIPRWAWGLGLIGLVVVGNAAGNRLFERYSRIRPVSITAHRGASKLAPENTLSAIRIAIEQGADYAEIDVHLTSDGVPILLHDEDFARLAGDTRKPGDLTLEEIQELDVGTPFDPKFAGERIATLAEVIELCRGKIRLNIELKPPKGGRDELAWAVAREIRDERFESSCFVTSLDRGAVEEAKSANSLLRTGAIISASVGDVTKLGVDVLSVRTGLVSERLLEKAHAAGVEVHAWTIDDPKEIARMIDVGVDGIITNEPELAVKIRDEREALPVWERILLGLRSRLDRGR
ncbi:MAG: glycerophosphodiester phosphodiesterase family protein [Isosphaeraceae bacterium]